MNALSGVGIDICFEHHAREAWPWFADRAAEAGASFVRFGEFVWDIVEGEEGRMDFSMLDEFVRLLAERGIHTVLATPTGSPPDWLCLKYPAIVPVKLDGTSYGTGVRRHTCPTSPRYRESCERVVRAMGRHYAQNPSVIAWQIDNEIGHPFCYCRLCHRAFREWLRERFGDIATCNARLGQFFLGRTSRRFEEVPLPEAGSNPSLHHAYHLFMDHQIRECWGLQRDWLRKEGVVVPITTNAMLTWYGYDHEKFFEKLDLVTGDAYPSADSPYQDAHFPGIAFYAAFLRGIKHGGNFGMMEMRCGPVAEGGPYPAAGEIKYWTHCYFATGADFVNFFRLDTCPSGMERGAFGLIPASRAIPPAFAEFRELSAEAKRLAPILSQTTVPTAPVGILYSHATHLAMQHRPVLEEFSGFAGNGYTYHLARHFRSLVDQNIAADIVYPGEEFAKYRVLIVTGLVLLDAALAAKVARFVESGGVLIVGPWTGLLDENAKMWEIPVPAHLDRVLGAQRVVTESFDPRKQPIAFAPAPRSGLPRLKIASVADQMQVASDVEVLATFSGHPAGDRLPALSRRQFDRGTAYSLAAFFDEPSLSNLYAALLKKHRIAPEMRVPRGIHHVERIGGDCALHFFFNSSARNVAFSPPPFFVDFFTSRSTKRLVLKSRHYAILRRKSDSREK
jgi:beta-galactosidase